MANIVNQYGQVKVGVRTQLTPPPSSLWTNVYSVYNADATGSSSLKTSLYAAYNGESNANDSFGSNNGTAMGGLTYTTGKIGNAFNFNGTTSYVELGDVMDVGTSSWTYSFWFKTNDAVNAGICFSKSFAGNSSGRFWGGYYNNRFAWNFQADTNVIYTETNNGSIVNNTWYHVVCVIDRNDKLKLYINGSLQTLNVTSGTNNLTPYVSYNFNTNNPFRIGTYTSGDNTTPTALFNGSIDAFNVWNRVLTATEVSELYNSGNGAQYIGDNFYKPTPNDALNTYNGTAQGGLTYGVGKVGTTFQFNGTNAYVSLPNNSFNFTGDFSVSGWINQSSTPSYHMIMGNQNSINASSGFSGWLIWVVNNKITFDIYNGTSGSASARWQTTNTLSTNTWIHFTITKKPNQAAKIYLNGTINGQLIFGSNTANVSYLPTTYSVIGVNKYSSIDGYWNGSIDALNVWNKELSATEITELYNSGNGKQYPN